MKKKHKKSARRLNMTNAKFPILTDEQKTATDRAKRVLKAWFDRGCPHNFDISA